MKEKRFWITVYEIDGGKYSIKCSQQFINEVLDFVMTIKHSFGKNSNTYIWIDERWIYNSPMTEADIYPDKDWAS